MNNLKLIEGGLVATFDNIVPTESLIGGHLIDVTMQAIVDELNALYPMSKIRVEEKGIKVTRLTDDVIVFMCSLFRTDPELYHMQAADGMLRIEVTEKDHNLDTWLTLQRIVTRYRKLLDNPIYQDEEEIVKLLAS